MSLLFKHLRVHQIFGANTDVGKTILTTALVRASASQNREVFYLKPTSTGPDADDEFDAFLLMHCSLPSSVFDADMSSDFVVLAETLCTPNVFGVSSILLAHI